jgi:hypothetical protein
LGTKIGGQVREEWDAFITYLQDKNIKSYLEIGAREGIALRYLVERLPTIEYVAAIDLPNAAWGRPKSDRELRENLKALGCEYKLFLGNSTDPRVIEAADREYDLVFIDADHSYAGVRRDYKNYKHMAKWLAFHDVNQSKERPSHGPTRLWHELEGKKKEFISPKWKKGIGLLVA